MTTPIGNPKGQKPYSHKPALTRDDPEPATPTPSLADIARSQGFQVDQGWDNNGIPSGGTRHGQHYNFTDGKTPDTLAAEGQAQKQKQLQLLNDAKKNGILDPKFDANGRVVGGVNSTTGQTLALNADNNLRSTGQKDMDALKAAQQRHAAAETAAAAPVQTPTQDAHNWNTFTSHDAGTPDHPTQPQAPAQQAPNFTSPVRTDSGAGVGGHGVPRDVALQELQDQRAAGTSASPYPSLSPSGRVMPYGKIDQSSESTIVVPPGGENYNGKMYPEGTLITPGPRGTIIQPPTAARPAAPAAAPAAAAPVTSAPGALADAGRSDVLPSTPYPSLSPSGTFRPGTFNGAPKTVDLGTGVNVPDVPDPSASGVPGFKAQSLGSTPYPSLSTSASFAGPTTADGKAIVAGQPASAASSAPTTPPAGSTGAASGLATRQAVGNAINTAGGAMDRASAATGNAVKNTIDAVGSFVTGSPNSVTGDASAYAPVTGEPSDLYASNGYPTLAGAGSRPPATTNDAATARMLDADARGGMGTTPPAGGVNQATKDMQADSTIALNNTAQKGTLPASTTPSQPSVVAGATPAATLRSFGSLDSYIPEPSADDVARASNGGTLPSSTTKTPYPSLTSSAAQDDTVSQPKTQPAGNAVYQPTTQPVGNAQYQPKDQPTGNASYNPASAAAGNAYSAPAAAAANPDGASFVKQQQDQQQKQQKQDDQQMQAFGAQQDAEGQADVQKSLADSDAAYQQSKTFAPTSPYPTLSKPDDEEEEDEDEK